MTAHETPGAPYIPGGAPGQTGAGLAWQGEVARPAPPPVPPPCVCSTPGLRHVHTAHDLAGDRRTRKACSWTLGPRGTPCGCRRYEPEVA